MPEFWWCVEIWARTLLAFAKLFFVLLYYYYYYYHYFKDFVLVDVVKLHILFHHEITYTDDGFSDTKSLTFAEKA